MSEAPLILALRFDDEAFPQLERCAVALPNCWSRGDKAG